ncbi:MULTISPECIES: hypothetical protein [unclassified Saccharothrix]|uniref:hypothetical protein n=1 Tax=unclassified Saccharothrix TaxID=2593673 RepID=UPI00307DF55A
MSTVSAAKPTSTGWVRFVASTVVCLLVVGLVAVVSNAVVGVVAGLAVAVLGVALNALGRASRTLDRIFTEELD